MQLWSPWRPFFELRRPTGMRADHEKPLWRRGLGGKHAGQKPQRLLRNGEPIEARLAGWLSLLAACDWIAERRNLLVTGASGLGKSWLGMRSRPQGAPRKHVRPLHPRPKALRRSRYRPWGCALRQAPALPGARQAGGTSKQEFGAQDQARGFQRPMCMSAMPESERQTARVALLIKPSMKRMVERRARTEGVTANEFIRRAIEQALAVKN
jgi:hypothetical protein